MIKNYIEVENKKYPYSITPVDPHTSTIVCNDANIDQDFLNEDIISLLRDLPSLILAEKEYKQKQDSVIRFRVSASDKVKIQKKVKEGWYKTISSFIKDKVLK